MSSAPNKNGALVAGLVPLLWADGSGADVMKRIAAPMVGGLITSAFLTLEIIPVIYTYWRQEQVLWDRLTELDPRRLRGLRIATVVEPWRCAMLRFCCVLALVFTASCKEPPSPQTAAAPVVVTPAPPPAAAPDAASATTDPYHCPMHPQVTSKDPKGECPICGMDLVPRPSGH